MSTGTPDVKYKEGEVFHRNGEYYQALSPTQVGDSLENADKFLKITQPVIGGVIDEKKAKVF